MYQPRDFIETHEGLVFAVVAAELEEQRVLASLRYIPTSSGTSHQKVTGETVHHLLESTYPNYLFYSRHRDVNLHGVPIQSICKHYLPRTRLAQLLDSNTSALPHIQKPLESIIRDLLTLMLTQGIDTRQIGITGSVLLGVQNPNSDIDLVIYDRPTFFKTLECVKHCIETGQLQALDDTLWKDAWQRRDCHLSLTDYRWHEQRKFNKAAIQGIKFDLSLVTPNLSKEHQPYQKQGLIQLQARVVDDQYSFDYPARYSLDHEHIQEVVCFTQTYVGQARKGEWIELSGQLERSKKGDQRVLIGTSREATNEYIKVIR